MSRYAWGGEHLISMEQIGPGYPSRLLDFASRNALPRVKLAEPECVLSFQSTGETTLMVTPGHDSTEDGPRPVTVPGGPSGPGPGIPGLQERERVSGPEGLLGAESDLIGGVRNGDPEAMAILYGRYRVSGLTFTRALISSAQEAEDLLHEAFVKAFGAIRNGSGPTTVFAPYLNTSIRSVALTSWKKAGRERPTPHEDLDTTVEDPGLENAVFIAEHGHIAAAMRTLPQRWRTVLWHAEVLGKKPRDIAPVLGIEPNAVSALLIRARAGLRAAYAKIGGTDPWSGCESNLDS